MTEPEKSGKWKISGKMPIDCGSFASGDPTFLSFAAVGRTK
jgi:hypothetical protein